MKVQKGVANVPHKHLHTRISYLYQAAIYLANVQISQKTAFSPMVTGIKPDVLALMSKTTDGGDPEKVEKAQLKVSDNILSYNAIEPSPVDTIANSGSTRLLSHLRSVSLKSQIKLSPSMKHSICKRCNTLLISGRTSTHRVENKSRGGRKAWAEILVVTCDVCGMAKRFPVGAKRQHRRTERTKTHRDTL